MDRIVALDIDHVGIICTDLSRLARLFGGLGFVTAGNTQMDTGISGEVAPTNMHFILDNTYVECIRSCPGDYLQEYLHSEAALHTVVLSSGDYRQSHRRVIEAGFHPSEAMIASRTADHGANKGVATFGWFKIMDNIIPDTLLGVAEHLTRDLIFQPERYRHLNTCFGVDQLITVCDQTLANAAQPKLEQLYRNLENNPYDSGIRTLRMMDAAEINAIFDIQVDQSRSHYVGMRFRLQQLSALLPFLQKGGYTYRQCSEGLLVDVTQEIGLFFLFTF